LTPSVRPAYYAVDLGEDLVTRRFAGDVAFAAGALMRQPSVALVSDGAAYITSRREGAEALA
jgi:hypothetical protein